MLCSIEPILYNTDKIHIYFLVFGLTKSAVSSSDEMTALEGAIYAISLDSASEQLPTAHQKDLQLLRDQLSNFQHAAVFDNAATDIEASVEMERRDAQASQQARWNQMGQVATDRRGASSNTKSSGSFSKARTTTTAQTFFGNDKKAASKKETTKSASSTSSSAKASGEKETATTAEPAAKKKKPFFGNASTTKTSSKTKSTKAQSSSSSTPASPPESEETENNANIGTADDFMGDEDEDEDFEEQETERQKRNATAVEEQKDREKERAARKKARDAAAAPEDEEPTVSVGKKRLKKMVEKTTMDEHGYMHTETTVVWEEVDDIAPVKPKRKAVKSTKNMKQGNLMGFFAKKK